MPRRILPAILPLAVASLAMAGPPSREVFERRSRTLSELSGSVDSAANDAVRVALFARAMESPDVELRRGVLNLATRLPGRDLERFLKAVLTDEPDAGLRGLAAKGLGDRGSADCLAALADCAAKDPTTDVENGCIRGRSSARRAATFALAELAARHPAIADEAAKTLRSLEVVAVANDPEGLADARLQALFRVTRDRTLLKPFFERLASREPRERENGVIAFRFLKLKEAPAEVVDALKDADPGVVSWACLVLGEIGDPEAGRALMAIAGDPKRDAGARNNAIAALGRMRLAAAADLMEQLLDDPDPAISTGAAIALRRITGKVARQFPEGFPVD